MPTKSPGKKRLSFSMTDPPQVAQAATASTTAARQPAVTSNLETTTASVPPQELRKPIGSRVTVGIYRRAKSVASLRGEKLQDWVERAILAQLEREEGKA